MNRRSWIIGSAVAVLALLPLQGSAQPKPEDVIDFRQGLYSVIGWHFGPLGAMAKGDMPFDAELAAKNSEIVAYLSRIAPDAFIEGSDQGETRALPEIWSQPDEFDEAMQRFQEEARELAEVAARGEFAAFRAQVGDTGKACKNCHDDFREDDD